MTHAEITCRDRKGFASTCPGELALALSRPDEVLSATAGGGGPLVLRTVEVWLCGECGRFVSAVAGGEVLNVYDGRPSPAKAGGPVA